MKFKSKLEEKIYYEQQATEEEFLEWYKNLDLPTYEKPSVTVDNVILAYDKSSDEVKMLMIKRKAHPYKDCWALPGGFVEPTESTDETVIREVKEEVGLDISKKNIEQLYTFSTPNRDPRTWVITVAYLTFLPELPDVIAGDDAKEAQWFSVNTSRNDFSLVGTDGTIFEIKTSKDKVNKNYNTNIAFDHASIIRTALLRIQGSLDWKPKVLNILGDTFTLLSARKVYSKFIPVNSYKDIDNSNFKKTHGKLFEEVGQRAEKVGRPAKVFKLKDTY